MGVPKNGWFTRENPIYKWMIWGHPYDSGNPHMAPFRTSPGFQGFDRHDTQVTPCPSDVARRDTKRRTSNCRVPRGKVGLSPVSLGSRAEKVRLKGSEHLHL